MSSYLELLNLTREPFSNSPDPDAYCRTPTHEDCLNRLEIAIRLRRGLNVVLGEVGTGKSTLCRCLLRTLNEREGIDVFLLLDAGFDDADEFVRHLCELFTGERPPEGARAGCSTGRWSGSAISSCLWTRGRSSAPPRWKSCANC